MPLGSADDPEDAGGGFSVGRCNSARSEFPIGEEATPNALQEIAPPRAFAFAFPRVLQHPALGLAEKPLQRLGPRNRPGWPGGQTIGFRRLSSRPYPAPAPPWSPPRAPDPVRCCLAAAPASAKTKSQSILRQRVLPGDGDRPRQGRHDYRLNRFFVSDYFRAAQKGSYDTIVENCLNRFFVSDYFRAIWSFCAWAPKDSLNRFFVSDYFRATPHCFGGTPPR